jgi:collagenase-like PrtC family protease
MMSRLAIPCHWKREIIDQILDQTQNNQGVIIDEVYGVLADGGPVGHGRAKESVSAVSQQEAVDFVKYLHSRGLKFTYLLNAPFHFQENPQQQRGLDQYLNWILRELRPDALTISSHELMEYVRQIDREINIHVSTIAGIRDVDDLKNYLDIHPDKVVTHHDTGKEWDKLTKIVEFGQKNGITIELMATESCLFRCPNREGHYEHLAKKNPDRQFHTTCNARKFAHPREFLMAGGVIRPEDLSFYEAMGVNFFKLTGRSKPPEWLPETVEAYAQRSYEGNLIRLLGIDPSLRAEEWFYIKNKALDGFLNGFPQGKDQEEKIRYCESWVVKLYLEGNLQVTDGTQYSTEGARLALIGEGGEKVGPVIRRERGI